MYPFSTETRGAKTDKYEPDRGAQQQTGGPSSGANDDDERSQSESTRYLL